MSEREDKIYEDITQLIGNTPMIRLNKIVPENAAEVIVKLESFNPGGSVKDRIALNMIKRAEEEGRLKPGGTIVEATSGNTGIGLAMVSAVKGYKLILVMPDTMSIERRNLLLSYGAELVLTPGAEGMKGAIKKAQEILELNPDYIILDQFKNSANPEIHELTTAKEILKDTNGIVDAFVAGVGTGGTISGVGKVLKQYNKDIKIFAVEPEESPVLSGGKPGPHKIQGIGAGFIPDTLNLDVIDEIIKVKERDAFEMSMKLAKQEGILCGISSGANVFAAIEVANRIGKGKRVVTVLPDTGERYLSMHKFFEY
ncbi:MULTISPECIES: cysteine synthase A [Thermoanaerobacter]|jgi:cysteine synthase A|uniref:Cysteine synthase n=2 Tax=Thermoanaerobacter TaxID=1754 RepID=B0KC12_THEP3|nr:MULTISPECIES: cysteine synthase A [Thermoanaerobacter]ABY92075.1 cysteine synthase A [Thermoanaerobacter sp. X514]ABY93948.1 cysteine synthase A [Thermoanaerobacter pseudethanolicus ATCC 33223]ADV78906.1 cysteine synthase A [Thermoanaerobacter brockii subsp. finnii Ako-1]HBW60136.1 cysteine synthase A [Thermoanaerobacter sp.]